MRTPLRHFLVLLTLGFLLPVMGDEGARVALVIGNGSYRNVAPLKNPENDAADLSAKFRGFGFDVVHGENLGLEAMRGKAKEFIDKLEGAELAVFFYAGHGLQVEGSNYLVPVDARVADRESLDFETMPLDLVFSAMERKSKVNLVFLDACRDNPFATNLARTLGTRSASVGRGLAVFGSGVGSLIAFATQPGNVAGDGEGRNSPFTAALLKHLGTPGRGIADELILVRREVIEVTDGKQVPWDNSSLTGSVVLVPPKDGVKAGRLELALVAVKSEDASGPPLHDIGDNSITYAIERSLTFPGDIASAAARLDGEGRALLDLELEEGALKRINGNTQITGRQLALVLDGRTVLSVATVREPLGGRFSMSGNFSFEEIERLVKAIAP